MGRTISHLLTLRGASLLRCRLWRDVFPVPDAPIVFELRFEVEPGVCRESKLSSDADDMLPERMQQKHVQ